MKKLNLKSLCEKFAKFNLNANLELIDPFKFDPKLAKEESADAKKYFSNKAYLISFENHKGSLLITHEGLMWPVFNNIIYGYEVDFETFVEEYLDLK
jgi:hypothetical protein